MPKVSLMDVHSTLSHLSFAVVQTLKPLNVGVKVMWDQWTYLSVLVECYERDKQMVIDRLSHGVLYGEYDYRFLVSYPTGKIDPTDWVTVKAYPDMSHDDKLFNRKAPEAMEMEE